MTQTCTILAGPNGSGKSTLYDLLDLPGIFINTDRFARRLKPRAPETATLAAGRETIAAISGAIRSLRSFTYETTLSSNYAHSVLRRASSANFHVSLVFICLRDEELNVHRVAQRVAHGGHDIPEETIRRRFDRSLSYLPHALDIAHEAILYDNSSRTGPDKLAVLSGGLILENRLNTEHSVHARLAKILAGFPMSHA